MEGGEEDARVKRVVEEYEKAGMWSHAAELADKHSEKTRDKALKTRALDNYEKAGYNTGVLEKQNTGSPINSHPTYQLQISSSSIVFVHGHRL